MGALRASQLRPYRALAIARAIVLDNWRQVGIDLSDEMLIQIFGQILFVAPVPVPTRCGRAPESHFAYGGGRALGEGAGEYISAVIVTEPLERDFDDLFTVERPMRARVLHNPHATVPLQRSIFAEEADEQLAHLSGAWQRLSEAHH